MSEYQDRIKQLKKRWAKSKPANTGGISRVPEGKYQGELISAKFNDKTFVVSWNFKILRGDHAGTILSSRNDLLWEPKNSGDPDGLAYFKAALESLSLSYDSPEPSIIKKTLKSAISCICDLYVKQSPQGYQNVFINGLIDAGPEAEEEEEEEVEEDEQESEDSDSEGEEDQEDEDEDVPEDDTEEDDEGDEDDEEEENEVEPLFPKGTGVTFTHDGDKYEGTYQQPVDDDTSVVTVTEDGEEEDWEVENEDLKRRPGRPKGAKNKKTDHSARKKKKVKKPEPKKEEAKTDEDDEEWEDEWEDD